MEKLTESLFEAHRNPIVKHNTTGIKIFASKNLEDEAKSVAKNLEILENTIKFPRVDRRCARSLAVWLEDEHLAKVIRRRYKSYGFQNKTGSYLYPEEALFLLETNKLEILWNDIPFTVQQAYAVIIKEPICSLDKYKIYKKLALQGYRISKPIKPIAETSELQKKRIKLSDEESASTSRESSPLKNISSAISSSTNKNTSIPTLANHEYKIISPRTKDSYNIHIIEDKELDPKISLISGDIPNLFGISLPDNVAFYKFGKVDIPDISNENG